MKKLFVAAAAAVVATAALAIVTFDPVTGSGFVGKGDVQIAFGWNNAQLQNKVTAGGLTFTYNDAATYDVVCEWDTTTGQGKIIHHDITIPRHRNINSAIEYDKRVRTQITGFILKKYSSAIVVDGAAPQVGDGCPGNSDHGLVTEVTLTGSTAGGLYVNYNGVGHLCTNGASCSPD